MADIVPLSARVDWTPNISGGVGVIGGVPTTRTQFGSTITSTGDSTDRTAEINAALAAATANTFVKLGPGTFRIEGTISIQNNNVTLRGSGSGQIAGEASTTLDHRTSLYCVSFGYGDWSHGAATAISGTVTKGTVSLTVASSSGFSVGSMARITQANDTTTLSLPVIDDNNNTRVRGQMTIVTGVPDSTHVTISPPLDFNYSTSLSPTIEPSTLQTEGIGIEDLIIDQSNNSNGTTTIQAWASKNCWVVNVKSLLSARYHFVFYFCINCEISHCWIDDSQTHAANGSGIKLHSCESFLIEDNVIRKCFPSTELNRSSNHNVISYNYVELADAGTPPSLAAAALDGNHDPHNSFNLYEGNIAQNFQSDGYFGSSSEDVLARNWFYGTNSRISDNWFCVQLNRFSRKYYVVGNALGTSGHVWTYNTTANNVPYQTHLIYQFGYPNIGNRSYNGSTAQLSSGDPWADWASYLASSYSSGPGGFQELDLDVAATTVYKGNWNANDLAVPASESLGSSTLSNSYYLSSTPVWFGVLSWPPIGPTGQPESIEVIPAGYRFVNGVEPVSPFAPIITVYPQSQTVYPGSDVTFSSSAIGNPTPTWQWFKDGVAISGATSSTLLLSSVSSSSAGTYTATATNNLGSDTSLGAVLTVSASAPYAPVITVSPQSQTALASSTVTFSASAIGSPAPTYQWYKNGIIIQGATSYSLVLSSITLSSAGVYTVVARNNLGSDTSSAATLTVTYTPTPTPSLSHGKKKITRAVASLSNQLTQIKEGASRLETKLNAEQLPLQLSTSLTQLKRRLMSAQKGLAAIRSLSR